MTVRHFCMITILVAGLSLSTRALGLDASVRSSGQFSKSGWSQEAVVTHNGKEVARHATESSLDRIFLLAKTDNALTVLITRDGDEELQRLFSYALDSNGSVSIASASVQSGIDGYKVVGASAESQAASDALLAGAQSWARLLQGESCLPARISEAVTTSTLDSQNQSDLNNAMQRASEYAKAAADAARASAASGIPAPPHPQYGDWQAQDLTNPGWRERRWRDDPANPANQNKKND